MHCVPIGVSLMNGSATRLLPARSRSEKSIAFEQLSLLNVLIGFERQNVNLQLDPPVQSLWRSSACLEQRTSNAWFAGPGVVSAAVHQEK